MMLLGEKRLSSLSDDSEKAENIAAGWDMLRDRALRRQAWHFAIQRTSLAADTATPSWGFDYQYSLAGDVVKVLQVGEYYPGPDLSHYRNSDSAPYRIEGRKIATNDAAPLKVKWVVNSVAVGEWDPSFAALMAADLAEYLQPRTVQSDATAQRIAAWAQVLAYVVANNPVVISSTAALGAIGNAINTAGKFTGKLVADATTKNLMIATGATAGSVWANYSGGSDITPA